MCISQYLLVDGDLGRGGQMEHPLTKEPTYLVLPEKEAVCDGGVGVRDAVVVHLGHVLLAHVVHQQRRREREERHERAHPQHQRHRLLRATLQCTKRQVWLESMFCELFLNVLHFRRLEHYYFAILGWVDFNFESSSLSSEFYFGCRIPLSSKSRQTRP